MLISHIELRTEDDKEVEPYVFHKQIEIIPAGEIPNTSPSISQSILNSMKGLIEPVFSIKEIVEYELQQLSSKCLDTLYQYDLLAIPKLSTLNRYIFKDIARLSKLSIDIFLFTNLFFVFVIVERLSRKRKNIHLKSTIICNIVCNS